MRNRGCLHGWRDHRDRCVLCGLQLLRYPALPKSIDDVVLIDEKALKNLPEYSQSIPTGVFAGKWWKRRQLTTPENSNWKLCCYVDDGNPDTLRTYMNLRTVVSNA
jgi:hypothetical protein